MKETYVEINLDILEKNVKEIKKKYKSYDYYIGVIKTDAYGLGFSVVDSLIKGGVNYLAVSYLEEALEVRKQNVDIPILCLQPIDLENLNVAIKNKITLTIPDLEYLENLNKRVNKKIKVHLKLDTGLNRLGIKTKEDLEKCIDIIDNNKYIELEGIYTHFATVGIIDKHFDASMYKFEKLLKNIDISKIKIIHIGGSSVLMSHPKKDFINGFRSGILTYGYNVSFKEENDGIKNKIRFIRNNLYKSMLNISDSIKNVQINIKPAVSMYTYINQIKEVKIGEYIGYGASYKVKENTKIAVLPIGYANGIGSDYVVGEIGMNMMSIKIDNDVKINDKVEVLGKNITLGMFSRFSNMGLASVLINIGRTNKRKYIKK